MNEEETLQAESETDISSSEIESSSEEAITTSAIETTTVAYEDTIQYDLNYNFGYISIWLGVICGFLGVLVFFKGFGND